jgi:predicted ester cyclase
MEGAIANTIATERLNAHDPEGLARLDTDQVKEDWPVVGHLEGRPAVADYFRALFAAIPDLHIEILRMAHDAETVFVHWRATGTFTGRPFNGIRATGRAIDLRGNDCFTIRAGKIVDVFVAYDGMAFAIEAGVLPRPGTAVDRVMTAAINAATRVKSLSPATRYLAVALVLTAWAVRRYRRGRRRAG